jgi:hypothetical protein
VISRGLRVRVSCSSACTGRADLLIDARTARRLRLRSRRSRSRAPYAIGKVALKLSPRRTETVNVKLSRKVRRRLRPVNTLRVTTRVRLSDAVGNAASVTRRITLRR